MREFDTGDLLLVRKQLKSSIKSGIAQKLVSKIKGTYRVLEKAIPISYWIQCLPLYWGIGSPGRKLKESADSMGKIQFTMVIHKHVDRVDTRFSTMSGPLVNNPLGKWLGVIRIGTYQVYY